MTLKLNNKPINLFYNKLVGTKLVKFSAIPSDMAKITRKQAVGSLILPMKWVERICRIDINQEGRWLYNATKERAK